MFLHCHSNVGQQQRLLLQQAVVAEWDSCPDWNMLLRCSPTTSLWISVSVGSGSGNRKTGFVLK